MTFQFLRLAPAVGVTLAGALVMVIVSGCASEQREYVTYSSTWGNQGADAGEFNEPIGVALDEAGNVYISDAGNNRIQKFSPAGAFLAQWDGGAEKLDRPMHIAVDEHGRVYVPEYGADRVSVFDSAGARLFSFGENGSADGEFDSPAGVNIDPDGKVYVADFYNHRVQIFDSSGEYLSQFGS